MDAGQKDQLEQIFGPYVRQETLESAAAEMAEVSKAYPELEALFVSALTAGTEAARAGDVTVHDVVEGSEYYAPTLEEAEARINDLHRLYVTELKRMSRPRSGWFQSLQSKRKVSSGSFHERAWVSAESADPSSGPTR